MTKIFKASPRHHIAVCVVLLLAAGGWASASPAWLPDAQGSHLQPEAKSYRYTQTRAFSGVDGSSPQAALIQASNGFLYGTTASGGAHGKGTVYRTNRSGKFKVLHAFAGGAVDGEMPYCWLIEASDGNFYGTTLAGGLANLGIIFKMTPLGAITVLHHFGVASGDGHTPRAGLVQASNGMFFGTTGSGGAFGAGTVYRMDMNGAVTVMWSLGAFAGDATTPYAGLVQANDGLLYGTSAFGGNFNAGTVFSIHPDTFSQATLHHFNSGDGYEPQATLLQASDGSLYGVTSAGGSHGLGTAFSVTLSGNLTVKHAFGGSAGGAINPDHPLIEGVAGVFYGTTPYGGLHNKGTVFRMQANGKLKVLHAFSGDLVGGYVDGSHGVGVVLTTDGELLGATSLGGINGHGSIYRLKPE